MRIELIVIGSNEQIAETEADSFEIARAAFTMTGFMVVAGPVWPHYETPEGTHLAMRMIGEDG